MGHATLSQWHHHAAAPLPKNTEDFLHRHVHLKKWDHHHIPSGIIPFSDGGKIAFWLVAKWGVPTLPCSCAVQQTCTSAESWKFFMPCMTLFPWRIKMSWAGLAPILSSSFPTYFLLEVRLAIKVTHCSPGSVREAPRHACLPPPTRLHLFSSH